MNDVSTGVALLQAILLDPADDLPRLAYADWLEETGGPEELQRAQMIRHSIAGGPRTYARSAWPDSLTRLAGGLDGDPVRDRGWDWHWERGFIAWVKCPLEEWRRWGSGIARAHPLERVTLTDRDADDTYAIGWRRHDPPSCRHDLPGWLWDLLSGGEGGRPGYEEYRWYESGSLAAEDLSRACILAARS